MADYDYDVFYDVDWIRPVSELTESEQDEEQTERPHRRAVLLGRPAVASTLTALGGAAAIVAATLPWSGRLTLLGVRSLATSKDSWLVWLVLSVAAAVLFAVLALIRPTRAIRRCGALFAVAAVGLSAWAVLALPPDRSLGAGPGLAVVALLVLAIGQTMAAVRRAPAGPWRWRPAAVTAAVAAVLLAGAGLGSEGLAGSRDVDATETALPPAVVAGALPTTLTRVGWTQSARLFDADRAGVLVAGQSRRGPVVLAGVTMLDLGTGRERWHHYERGWSVREAAIVGDTALLVVNTNEGPTAFGFDAVSGAPRWRHRLAGEIDCGGPDVDSIVPAGGCSGQFITGAGVLFVGGPSRAAVTYVSARDGRAWPVRMDGPGCRPRGAGGDADLVYVLIQCVTHARPAPHLRSERAVAYDLAGHLRWSVPLDVVPNSYAGDYGPVFPRAHVVLFQQEQTFAALDMATGVRLWTTTDPLEPEDVVTDGTRLIWTNGVLAIALDARTGDQVWRREWQFPDVADLPLIDAGRLHLVRHVLGPTPASCGANAALLNLNPATGRDARADTPLPDGPGSECGPDVRNRAYALGSYLVLANAGRVLVLA